jgi:hypothetical protein
MEVMHINGSLNYISRWPCNINEACEGQVSHVLLLVNTSFSTHKATGNGESFPWQIYLFTILSMIDYTTLIPTVK